MWARVLVQLTGQSPCPGSVPGAPQGPPSLIKSDLSAEAGVSPRQHWRGSKTKPNQMKAKNALNPSECLLLFLQSPRGDKTERRATQGISHGRHFLSDGEVLSTGSSEVMLHRPSGREAPRLRVRPSSGSRGGLGGGESPHTPNRALAATQHCP